MLDNTPITVTLTAAQLGHARGAIRWELRRRERALARSNFVAPPGCVNMGETKVARLREADVILEAAIAEYIAAKEKE